MLRKMMIALFASASVAMLAPDAASARGGFGGGGAVSTAVAAASTVVVASGGGGFRGGGMGMGGGGFRAAGIGGGGFRPRSAARFPFGRVALVSVRPLCRLPDFAAALLPSTVSAAASTTDFRHRRFPFAAAAVGSAWATGYYGAYGYDDYYPYYGSYDDSYYYGDSGCYIVRRSVLTPYGWRIRPVQVCG